MEMTSLELDVACYATAVYHEVNTRSLEEKVGVINVIRNRLHTGRWGYSVCSVVYANNQFAVQDESHDPVDERAYLETKLLVIDTIIYNKHTNPVADALYFHDDSIKTMDGWGKKKVKIGRMVFY